MNGQTFPFTTFRGLIRTAQVKEEIINDFGKDKAKICD